MADKEPAPVWYPTDNGRLIRAARFFNILDEAHNILSPVKINLWAANLTVFSAGAATVMAWLGGHMHMIGDLWTPIGGWLAQAHAAHHFDKRERNLQAARMKDE